MRGGTGTPWTGPWTGRIASITNEYHLEIKAAAFKRDLYELQNNLWNMDIKVELTAE